MSVGRIAGAAAMGHLGWVEVRCIICARWILITKDEYYECPKCKEDRRAIFCSSCAKKLHYRCPFCGVELRLA